MAVLLYAKKQQFVAINPTDDPGRKEFAFVKTKKLEELVDLYKFGDRGDLELSVQVHLYEQARRDLLDRLNDR